MPVGLVIYSIYEWDYMSSGLKRVVLGLNIIFLIGFHRILIFWRIVDQKRIGYELEGLILLVLIEIVNESKGDSLDYKDSFQLMLIYLFYFLLWSNGTLISIFILYITINSIYELITLTNNDTHI